MSNTTEHLNHTPDHHVLDHYVTGYHQYVLEKPVHVCFASRNLCEMTGCSADELAHTKKDLYASRVHPGDRKKYRAFLARAAEEEGTFFLEYRLVTKDNRVLLVRDSFTSKKADDGTMTGYSVLSDISDLSVKLEDQRFLTEIIPFGLLRYTCEKQPRVTYVNQNMLDLLHFSQNDSGEVDYLELYKSNVFLMIPMEERHRFSRYLDRVYKSDRPLAGEMKLLCFDGARVNVFGWVAHSRNDQGEEEFLCVCMDISERQEAVKAAAENRYLKTLTDVYDKIFEFDIDSNTVKCLACEESSMFNKYLDLSMQIGTACEKWIVSSVISEERDKVRTFFDRFVHRNLGGDYGNPPQITYHAMSSDGTIRHYSGTFVKAAEASSYYYCCSDIADPDEAEILRTENDQLKRNMQHLIRDFVDGVAAFEVTEDEHIRPLFTSDNVCDFFGFSREEWIDMIKDPVPIRQMIAYSGVSYEDFQALMEKGVYDFTYYDSKAGQERRIRANCSSAEAGSHAARFIMLYWGDGSEAADENGPAGSVSPASADNSAVGPVGSPDATGATALPVRIRTFGHFDVFVGNRPIAFRNKKSEELFALLVDRRGGFITSEEAIGYLWADESANSLTLARYRKAALRLKNTLEEYGIADIIETVDGKRRIIPEKVSCDLFDYLSGEKQYAQLFRGSYMSNYSWAEITLGQLQGELM